MKWHLVLSAIIFSACLVAINSHLMGSDRVVGISPRKLESGDYLSRRYLAVLEKTHSPLAAEEGRVINVVSVRKTDNIVEVQPIMNFHEGGPIFRIDQSGTVTLEETGGLDIKHYLVQIVGSNEIAVGFDNCPSDRFVFVKDLQRLVREKSIAGTYVDAEGRPYKFQSDGLAVTPTGTFKFTIGIDHIPYHFDYIEHIDTHQIHKYFKIKCRLEIYEILDAIENQHGNDGSKARLVASLCEVGCKEE